MGGLELKTKQHDADVFEFINTFANTEQKREDSLELVKLMQEFTGHPPKMWGPTMIGFGCYHYKSDRSRQEGDWPLVGFSPRKAAISLYVLRETPIMSICSRAWASTKSERPASILRSCQTSTKRC